MKKKEGFKEIWEKIESFAIILIIWTLLATILPLQDWIGKSFVSILTWVIQLGAFILLGYQITSKDKELLPTKYGAYLGAILGLAYAVIGIASFYLFPQNYQEAINQAVQAGADVKTVMLFVKIGIYFNLLLMPVLTGAIGAFVTWLSSLITKESKKKNKKNF